MKVLRNLSLLTVTVMLLGILAACGGGQPAGQAPAATTAAEPTAAAEPAQPAEAAPPAEARSFTVASDASFPPMEFVDENKALTGFDIDLINAIAADQGFTVEIQNTAWDGIFAGLEAGQYDAIISSVTVTEERKAAMDFSDPYFNANQAIVVLAEDTAIAGEADLQGKTVGVQIETTGAIAVRELGIEPKQYDSPDLALQDMVNGNIDAVVVDTPVAANYALQAPQFEGKLKISGKEIDTSSVDDDGWGSSLIGSRSWELTAGTFFYDGGIPITALAVKYLWKFYSVLSTVPLCIGWGTITSIDNMTANPNEAQKQTITVKGAGELFME